MNVVSDRPSALAPSLRLRLHTGTSLAACLIAASLIAGCEADTVEPERAPESGKPQISAPTAPLAPEAPRHEGPAFAAIAEKAVAAAAPAAVAADKARVDAIAAAKADRAVLEALYPQGRLRFYAWDGNLSRDGKGVVDLLAILDDHGVDTRGYRFAELDQATAAVRDSFAAERELLLGLGKDVAVARVGSAAAALVRGQGGGQLALVRAGGDDLDGDQRWLLDRGLDAVLGAASKTRVALWHADVEIARAVIRYVIDFEHARVAHPQDYMTPGVVRRLATTKADAIIARLTDARGRTAEVMRDIWPKHPQYQRLLKAVPVYKALVDAGGWEKLPALPGKKIEKGAHGVFVGALRARLRAEGYEVGDDSDRFDDALAAAVVTFQSRHQLDPDGVVSRNTVAEIDVSAARRLAQIKLGLQRYREAEARDPEDVFFHVNIASQEVFFYDGGKELRRHRVIVGKDADDIDFALHIKGKINRTKMFSATMTKVTLAPRWYPTPRVIDIELGAALAREPDYYVKHGYVSEMNADGTETVYQRSGDENLLGVVKFQFPNRHAIYMHDTPSRGLFKRARRAYSHGCIRMHEAAKMAYFILGRDRGWRKKKIKDIMDEREEKVVMLKKPIEVHIDYVTTRVEEDGTILFSGDIYDYDAAYFAGQLPVEEFEDYEPASVKGL